MTIIYNPSKNKKRSFSPKRIRSLTYPEKHSIQQFVTKFEQMDILQRTNTLTFLHGMVQKSIEAFINRKQHQQVSVTYCYPQRGHPNDGNPALMAILDLMSNKNLEVNENEYTKQQAIWLCEDYTVSWNPKENHTILTSAYDHISNIVLNEM